MIYSNDAPRISVNPSPLPDQAWAALRQIAPPVMAFLIGRHWIADDVAVMLGIVGAIIWPIVAGQIQTRHRATQLANIAADPRVPDAVAALKETAS
jgi:hypothetical protein